MAWCPVNEDFNARFSCLNRTYKYYFPRSGIDITAMRTAAQYLCGTHDFRNLCKMDIKNGVSNFERRIDEVSVDVIGGDVEGYAVCEITIVGTAFLWHQIRCIIAVLFMVGKGSEKPSIIQELLDITANPRKPNYNMASELPLVLFDSQYADLKWNYGCEQDQQSTVDRLQSIWTENIMKATVARRMLDTIQRNSGQNLDFNQQLYRVSNNAERDHRHLMGRNRSDTFEDRVEYALKRQKLVHVDYPSAGRK